MSFLLRKFSLSKWEQNRKLPPEQFTADSITGCTRTAHNTLSVWRSESNDFNSEIFKDLTVSLAITMNKPDTIDLIWLEEQWFTNNGIDVVSTPGNSNYEMMNDFHRDLSFLNHHKLALVGSHIVEKLQDESNYKRINRKVLISMVCEKVIKPNTFELWDLSEEWQIAVKKQMQ